MATATVVDAGLQGAAYRRTWVVLDERGETVTCTFSFPHAVDARVLPGGGRART